MATIHVSLAGSDANNGSSVALAKRTIQAAVTLATTGDTVLVRGDAAGVGVYDESVTYKSNVTIKGEPTLPKPVLDSNYTKGDAFQNSSGPANAVIESFEIRRYIHAGVRGYGNQGLTGGHPNAGGIQHNSVIRDCHIHHIAGRRTVSYEYSYGCYLVYGNWTVEDCEIHHVDGWNESTGIWFGYCKNHTAQRNTIYSIRKEGIRSYMGLGGRIVDNNVQLCYSGLSPNEDASSLWANNVVAYCTDGVNPKHTNDPNGSWNVLGYWGITDSPAHVWVRVFHNTFHRCSWAQAVVAVNTNGDGTGFCHKLDLRNNIYSGRSPTAFWDAPGARTSSFISNYNLYSTQAFGPGSGAPFSVYMSGYGSPTKTLAQLRADLGFDLNSLQVNPALISPDTGNFDYLDTSPAFNAGQNLTAEGSDWGSQMGARGVTALRDITYTPHLLTVHSGGTQARDETVFSAVTGTPPQTFILYLGSTKTFNHVFGDNLQHLSGRNPKRVKLETAADPAGPWTVVLDQDIYDSGGASWKFELTSAPTARYLRFTFPSAFSGTTVDATDVRVGFLSGQGAEDPDPGDLVPPTVSLTAPANGAVVEGDVALAALAADNIGISHVEFYVDDTQLITIDTVSPYTAVWSTTPEEAGQHSLTARAYDAAGNVTASAAVIVTVVTAAAPVVAADYWGVRG